MNLTTTEAARLLASKRKRFGRCKQPTPCPKCGEVQDGYREARAHCRNKGATKRRA